MARPAPYPCAPVVPWSPKPMTSSSLERVVLLDESGRPIGDALKSEVHTTDTRRHLAFSCYAFDRDGRVLMTRRALGKRTWPGVWTGSCCGHPAPGEDPQAAVVRRLEQELGVTPSVVSVALAEFSYRAVDASGVVENELCPVYLARVDRDPRPEPDEVAEWQWASWDDIVHVAATTPWLLSPWAVLQIAELAPVLPQVLPEFVTICP